MVDGDPRFAIDDLLEDPDQTDDPSVFNLSGLFDEEEKFEVPDTTEADRFRAIFGVQPRMLSQFQEFEDVIPEDMFEEKVPRTIMGELAARSGMQLRALPTRVVSDIFRRDPDLEEQDPQVDPFAQIVIDFPDPPDFEENPFSIDADAAPQHIKDALQRGLHYIGQNQGPSIEQMDFNSNDLRQFFADSLDPSGNPADFVQWGRDVMALFDAGLAHADDFERPSDGVHAVLRTFAQAIPRGDPPIIKEALEAILANKGGLPGLRLDVADMVDRLLGPHAERLKTPNLSGRQVDRLSQFLSQRIEQIVDPEELGEWEQYLGNVVASGELRERLLDKIRSKVFIEPVQTPPEQKEFSVPVQTMVLGDPFVGELNADISQVIGILNQYQSDEAMGFEDPDDFNVILTDGQNLLANFNRISRRHDIQVVEDGTSRPLLFDVNDFNDLDDLKDGLESALSKLKVNLIYTFRSGPSRGMLQDTREVVDELRSTLSRKPTFSGDYIAHPERTVKMGHIVVAKEGDVREIVLPPETTMEELLKLAVSLGMDGGRLESVDGSHVLPLDVSPGTIVSFFQELFDLSGGKIIRVLYFPNTMSEFVDGVFKDVVLGGSLAPMSKPLRLLTRLPVSAYTKLGGGLKVSDLVGTVGNVVGSVGDLVPLTRVITTPVRAISNVVQGIGKLFGF